MRHASCLEDVMTAAESLSLALFVPSELAGLGDVQIGALAARPGTI